MQIIKYYINFLGWYSQTLKKSGFSEEFIRNRTISVGVILPLLIIFSCINFFFSDLNFTKINPLIVALILIIVLLFITNHIKKDHPFWKEIRKKTNLQISSRLRIIYNVLLLIPIILFILSVVL